MSYIDRIQSRLAEAPDPDVQRLLEAYQDARSDVSLLSKCIRDFLMAAEYVTPKAYKEAREATPAGVTYDVFLKAWLVALVREGAR